MKKIWVVSLIIVIMMFLSCKTTEENNDDDLSIFGTWQYEFTYLTQKGRETAILNPDYSFEILFEAFINNVWVFLPENESARGTFVIANNTITLTVTDSEYYNGTWQQVINPPEVYSGTFTISNDDNTLTLQLDFNGDGDYNDDFENVVYTRIS